MNITEFKTELAKLIEKGSIAGLLSDEMADELAEAADDLPSYEASYEESDERAGNPTGLIDPVGYLIASHRP